MTNKKFSYFAVLTNKAVYVKIKVLKINDSRLRYDVHIITKIAPLVKVLCKKSILH